MPTGQPNSTVFRSSPMRRRSSAGIDLSQSRTGSRPAAVLKKMAGTRFIEFGHSFGTLRYVSHVPCAVHKIQSAAHRNGACKAERCSEFRLSQNITTPPSAA
jgi:hypothetical protein